MLVANLSEASFPKQLDKLELFKPVLFHWCAIVGVPAVAEGPWRNGGWGFFRSRVTISTRWIAVDGHVKHLWEGGIATNTCSLSTPLGDVKPKDFNWLLRSHAH